MGKTEPCAFCGLDDEFQVFPNPHGTGFICDNCLASGKLRQAAQLEQTIAPPAQKVEAEPVTPRPFAPLNPSARLSARIQELIDALDPDPVKASATLAFKNYSNALPIHYHALYLWAITPGGAILCKGLDSSRSPEAETNAEQIREIIEHGAKNYPELRELLV
jgi:hypothetical protein